MPRHGLISRQFFRCRADASYVGHDYRVWEIPRRAYAAATAALPTGSCTNGTLTFVALTLRARSYSSFLTSSLGLVAKSSKSSVNVPCCSSSTRSSML